MALLFVDLSVVFSVRSNLNPDLPAWLPHRHPELSFKEFETTAYVVRHLEEMGYRVERPLETGCVAVLEGGSERPSIALRADIDGLPIHEEGP